MKVVSQLLLLATVPFLALAKNPTAKNRRDARFLKKKGATKTPKTPKTPKASAPSSATISAPTSSPTEFPDVLVFYGGGDENTTALFRESFSENDDQYYSSFQAFLDLGVVKGYEAKKTPVKDTMAMVQASFTTAVQLFADSNNDDDFVVSEEAGVSLSILAYSGCDSAASCEAAGVSPTPLIPEEVEMMAVQRSFDLDTGTNVLNAISTGLGVFSTNEANFLLVGKGNDDIFLKAVITINLRTDAGEYDTSDAEIIVKDWVVFVEDGFKIKAKESNGYTLSPTIGDS